MRKLLVAGCWFVVILVGCARDTIDRAEWARMSHEDRVLYVRSLMGAEQVKEAKGGGGRTYDRPAEVYMNEIDRAYARGEQREVPEVFAELSR